MTHVATLISSPTAPATNWGVIETVSKRLKGAAVAELADGIAADVFFTAEPGTEKEIAEDLRPHLGAPVDVVVQPIVGRAKGLLIADMDSTMIGEECIDELAAELGLKDHISAITERAMRGEIEFEPALRERVALLAGLPAKVVDRVIAERIHITPGAVELVRTMRANGGAAWLVSGGFTLFTGRIGAMIGFDEHRANVLGLEGGHLSGTVAEPILGREAKRDTLVEVRTAMGLAPAETMAVGDGANDLAMLGEAGLGVAFRAKPQVAAEADARIEHGDLTALLYIQGYTADDFVA